ncbi:MAG: LEPR-XLL domain-containing protein, partial [Dehalococcoidales bacterium]
MTRKVQPLIQLEQLESRILLSGDSLLNIAPELHEDTIFDNTPQVVQYAELLDTQEQVGEQINLELVPSDTPNTDVCQPIITLLVDDNTNDESVDADLSVDNIGLAQTGDVLAVLSNDSDGDIESKVGITEDDNPPIYVNDAEINIEENTSIEIRGPPGSNALESVLTNTILEDAALQAENNVLEEDTGGVQTEGVVLPGLHLVEPTGDRFDGQVIYLDFDGETDVTYNGPVVVEGIDIPVFSAESAGLAGQEQEIINQVIAELEQTYAGTGIIFTTLQPTQGSEYSTIYIGGDDSAFSEYGSFLGLAETVDVGNRNRADDGFVFSDELFWISPDTSQLVGTIAHEVGHLLGYSHLLSHPLSCELSEFAATTTQPISLSATDEPIWAGGVGFDKSVTVWDWSPSSLPWTFLGYGITDLNTSLSARAYASTGTVSVNFGSSLDISYPDSVQPGQQNVPLTISAGLSPGTMDGVLGAGIDIPLTFGMSWQLPWPLPDGNLDFTLYLEDVLGWIGFPIPPDISLNTSAIISPQFGTTNTASGS